MTLPRSSKSQRVTLSVLPGRTLTLSAEMTMFGSRMRTGQILCLMQICIIRYQGQGNWVPPLIGPMCCLPPASPTRTSCKSSSHPTGGLHSLAGDWSGMKSRMTVRIIIYFCFPNFRVNWIIIYRKYQVRRVQVVLKKLKPKLTCQVSCGCESISVTGFGHSQILSVWLMKNSLQGILHQNILLFDSHTFDSKKVWCFWSEKSKNPITLKNLPKLNAWDLKWQCRMGLKWQCQCTAVCVLNLFCDDNKGITTGHLLGWGYTTGWKVCKISDLTLSSSEGGGELQGNSFGVFQHVRDGDEGHIYQQRHDGDGDGDFMYRFKMLIIVWKLKNQRS